MSTRHGSVTDPSGRTDTLIGADMRVAGRIAFTGVLRVQGDVLGDVTCQGDAGGTLVVDATGSVTGAVEAPRIVVRGRVIGPLRAAQSIDLQPGGNVVGDASYREIVIHAGGLIDGVLTPALPADDMRGDRPGRALPAVTPAPLPPTMTHPVPDAGGAGRARRIGGRVALGALAIAVAAGVWMSRTPPTPAPPAADAAAKEAAPPPAAEPAAPPAPPVLAAARPPVQPASPAPTAADAEEVIVVQGVNPAKPAGVFLLVSKEPTVLYRKKREEAGEGRRHVVPQGRAVSVAIGRNEVFRVAEGRNPEIFYQGRKVSPKAIETGAWLHFVPHGAGAAGEGRPGEAEGVAVR